MHCNHSRCLALNVLESFETRFCLNSRFFCLNPLPEVSIRSFVVSSSHKMNLSRGQQNSFIGMRIQLLTSQINNQVGKNSSPTLKELEGRDPSRVKTVSGIFEKKPWSLKRGCNWWINNLSPIEMTPLIKVETKVTPAIPEFDGATKIKEILKIEQEHVAQLEQSMEELEKIVCNGVGFIPMKLRENSFCLFGDLKNIYGLHNIVILPELRRAVDGGESCSAFMELMIRLIDDGHLYCYVSHKMQERSIRKLYGECVLGLHQHQFLNPFNILDAYHEFISNICNQLMKHPAHNADEISTCIEAEKKLMDLLDVIGDAGSVSHIAQVSDVAIETQFKIFNIIQKREKIAQPMLLVVPKKNFRFGYRYPVRF